MSAKRLAETRERVKDGDLWLSDAEYLLAEVDRLRAQVAAVRAIRSRPVCWLTTGIYGRGVSDVEIIAALAGDEAQR
jgi:hypothetical protein